MKKELKQAIDNIISDFKRMTSLNCSFYPCTDVSQLRFEIDDSNWFCKKIASTPDAYRLCEKKRLRLMTGAIQTGEPIFSECHAAIGEFTVPCYSEKKLIGIFVAYTVPAVEFVPNILRQKDYYLKQFGIPAHELEQYLEENPALERHRMRPSMLLLHSLVRMNIDSGFLPSINTGNLPGVEVASTNGDVTSDYPLSFTNIILEGEKGENPYKLIEANAVQLTHRLYTYLRTGRIAQAKEQYERLFRPALLDENIRAIRFNTLTAYFRLAEFLMRESPDFWDIYQLSIPIPELIMTADSSADIDRLLAEYLEDVITCYGGSVNKSPIVNRMVEFIENNYHKPITLEMLANQLHMSPAYASRLFKKYMGVNLKWYLNEVRMDATYNYLKRTQIPIQEIAIKVGYVEIRSFYKMFKSHFGVTCSQIRELYSSQQKNK